MRRTTRFAGDVGLLLLAGSVVASAYFLVVDRPGEMSRTGALPAPLKAVAIIDELSITGADAPSALEVASSALEFDLTVLSATGSGFTTAPPGRPNLSAFVDVELAQGEYDLVLVQGGAPDTAASPGTLGAAALGVIDRVRMRVPQRTRIVLIGPITAPSAEGDLDGVREVLREVALRKRVAFLDPIGAAWVDPATPGVPLTAGQQRQVAQRLTEELRDLGLDRA